MEFRVVRLRDASRYLGMDKNRFNKEVRPFVEEFFIGVRGIGFDKDELDSWLDQHKINHKKQKHIYRSSKTILKRHKPPKSRKILNTSSHERLNASRSDFYKVLATVKKTR